MEEETKALVPVADGKVSYTQMTLAEEQFCELVAEGKATRRGAYRIAFDKPLATNGAIDQWLHRVKENRPDIAQRINEYKTAVMEERRELWLNRQWQALEKLWTVFIATIGNPELAMIGVKTYQLMASTLGWTPGNGVTANVTVNSTTNAVAVTALPKEDANGKIEKLLELSGAMEGAH